VLLDDFLNTLDLDRLDIDIRVGRPREGHKEYFLEQLVLLVFVDVRAAEDIQYVFEICECHYVLLFEYGCRKAGKCQSIHF
jgi:hypothetical protein